MPDVNFSIDYFYNGAWVSGNFGDTLFTTLYPDEPVRPLGDDPGSDFFYSFDAQEDNFSIAASSFHPGGCNFAFLDGSVRFIKESINTWPYNPANGAPTNVSYNSSTGLFTAGPPMGVYQSLSTRAGGEVDQRRPVLTDSAFFASFASARSRGLSLRLDATFVRNRLRPIFSDRHDDRVDHRLPHPLRSLARRETVGEIGVPGVEHRENRSQTPAEIWSSSANDSVVLSEVDFQVRGDRRAGRTDAPKAGSGS